MEVVVYVLRRNGVKLPAELVKQRPAPGWLYYGRDTRKVSDRVVARLYRDRGMTADILEPLVKARVEIRGGGIMVYGSEIGREDALLPQAWWCLPGPLDDLTAASHR